MWFPHHTRTWPLGLTLSALAIPWDGAASGSGTAHRTLLRVRRHAHSAARSAMPDGECRSGRRGSWTPGAATAPSLIRRVFRSMTRKTCARRQQSSRCQAPPPGPDRSVVGLRVARDAYTGIRTSGPRPGAPRASAVPHQRAAQSVGRDPASEYSDSCPCLVSVWRVCWAYRSDARARPDGHRDEADTTPSIAFRLGRDGPGLADVDTRGSRK
jgi:hypothetical protein